MQWPSLCGETPIIYDETAFAVGDVWVKGPDVGSFTLELAQILWPALEPRTKTRDTCFFAIWEGFGGLPRIVLDAPAFDIPARMFYLFTGPLEAIEQTFSTDDAELGRAMDVDVVVVTGLVQPSPEAFEAALAAFERPTFPASYQSANLWWPADRAWCVATEIDFNTTYVAGSQTLVTVLLEHPGLEAYQVDPADGVSYAGDTINPLPADPYGGNFGL